MSTTSNRSGFTKNGFSKAGFACCSKWQQCDLGRIDCAWETIDSEVKDYCHCYKRNHLEKAEVNYGNKVKILSNVSLLEQEKPKTEKQDETYEIEQLSLF